MSDRPEATRRVLVVEDDDDIQESLAELLRGDGFQVDGARHGAEALAVLRGGAELPEAILLDLRMPTMDGWTFRAEQRRDPALAGIPVLAMSADSSPQALAIDAAAFLSKPLESGHVLGELRRVLDEARARQQAEAEAHRERLAGLGRLAAGVAHEINNPLAWTSANLRLLQERLPALLDAVRPMTAELEELPQLVAEALEGTTRIRDIVVQVRNLSQPRAAHHEPVNVVPALESALKMMELQARHSVRVVRALQPVPDVKGDPTQLGQLFVNLLMNAADAVMARDGGQGEVRVRTGAAGGRVKVEVSDDGVGIPDSVRRRIFDPFFTTKEVGKGTGLGLFLCHEIVSAMGGRLEVESEQGLGTTVRVALPALAKAAIPEPRAVPEAPGRARVLVVEDEPILGRALVRLLGRRYEMEVVTSVDAAEALLEQGKAPDVILCDIHLPDRGGPELHALVQARFAELEPRMIFMSGGALSRRTEAFIDALGDRVLSKPLDSDQLDAVLRRVLGGAPPA